MFRRSIAITIVVFGSLLLLASIEKAEGSDVQLREMVVTATKTEKNPQDVTQSVTVITADELMKSGATTVAEAMKNATAVDIKNYGPRGAVSNVSLRGAGYQQVLVLLDGKRMNSASSGGFDLSALPIPLDAIERIEIVRGSSSALYGADAVGGVVNIITKTPAEPVTTLSGSMGRYRNRSLGLGTSGRRDTIYYSLSVGKETSDGYLENSDLDQDTMGVKLGYDAGRASSLEATMDYTSKELGVPGSSMFPSPLARQRTREMVSGLRYKARFSKELDASVNVYETRERIAYQNPDPLFPEDSRHRSVTTGAEAQVNWLANSWNLMTVGAESREDRLVSSDAGSHTASLSAGYLQDEISMGDAFTLVVGGRSDSHSVYGDKFSPRASARIIDAETNTILRASVGKSFRAPTLNDLYWPDMSWSVGNPSLRPEVSEENEIGLEQALGKGSSIKVTRFDRKVKDLIEWQLDANFKYSPVNIGKARIIGIEAEAKFILFESVSMMLNYTHMDPVNELTGERIYYTIPNIQAGGTLQMALASDTSLSLEGRRVKNYVMDGEEKWDYYTVDGKISETIAARKGMQSVVFIGVKNMFNRKYESVRGYPMPAQELYGGLALRF